MDFERVKDREGDSILLVSRFSVRDGPGTVVCFEGEITSGLNVAMEGVLFMGICGSGRLLDWEDGAVFGLFGLRFGRGGR